MPKGISQIEIPTRPPVKPRTFDRKPEEERRKDQAKPFADVKLKKAAQPPRRGGDREAAAAAAAAKRMEVPELRHAGPREKRPMEHTTIEQPDLKHVEGKKSALLGVKKSRGFRLNQIE